MKRVLFVLAGLLVIAAVGFVVGSIATSWYSDHFAKSDDDINASVGVFLVLWPVFVGLGAYLGYRLPRQKLGDQR